MATPDIVLLAVIAVVLLIDHFVLWPGFVRRSGADPGRARLWIWSSWMTMLWALTLAVVALWLFESRDFAALGLTMPAGWRLWGPVALILAIAFLYARTAIKVVEARRGSKRIRKLGDAQLEKLLPHRHADLGWWVALSLSAGFCEELIFRGYLIWVFQPAVGLWAAAALSLVVFTLAHAYQGAKWMLGPGAYGLFLTIVVVITGSLVPAIVLHAIVDIGQGIVGWLALDDAPQVEGATSAGATSPHA